VSFESPGRSSDPRQARPAGARIGHHEKRPASRPWHLATGSLACPQCDAPVILAADRARPTDLLQCPFCDRAGAIRDFLSLAMPARAPRVHVLVRV
jgi:hypothetical protein